MTARDQGPHLMTGQVDQGRLHIGDLEMRPGDFASLPPRQSARELSRLVSVYPPRSEGAVDSQVKIKENLLAT